MIGCKNNRSPHYSKIFYQRKTREKWNNFWQWQAKLGHTDQKYSPTIKLYPTNYYVSPNLNLQQLLRVWHLQNCRSNAVYIISNEIRLLVMMMSQLVKSKIYNFICIKFIGLYELRVEYFQFHGLVYSQQVLDYTLAAGKLARVKAASGSQLLDWPIQTK